MFIRIATSLNSHIPKFANYFYNIAILSKKKQLLRSIAAYKHFIIIVIRFKIAHFEFFT